MGLIEDRGVFNGLNGCECIDSSKYFETEPMLILTDDYKWIM